MRLTLLIADAKGRRNQSWKKIEYFYIDQIMNWTRVFGKKKSLIRRRNFELNYYKCVYCNGRKMNFEETRQLRNNELDCSYIYNMTLRKITVKSGNIFPTGNNETN